VGCNANKRRRRRSLSHFSSLSICVTAVRGFPNGLCTFRPCPACANKFYIRVFRKSLCEIFLHPNEEKRMWLLRMVRSKRWEKNFCPLPCATVDRIGILHSISLIYVTHVVVIIRHKLRLYGLPISITEITLCWYVVYVCQNTYITFVLPFSPTKR
jgi:hypothetical protein